MFQIVFSFLFSPLVIVKATNGPRYVVGCRRQVTFYICIVLHNWQKCFEISYLIFQEEKLEIMPITPEGGLFRYS